MKKFEIILIIIFVLFTFCSCNGQEQKNHKEESILIKLRVSGFISMLEEAETGEERNLVFALKAWQIIFSAVKFNEDTVVSESAQETAGRIIIRNELSSLVARVKTGKISCETTIFSEDKQIAMKYLYDAFCVIADDEGDKNGKASEEEQKNLAEKYIYSYSLFRRVLETY